MKIVLFFLFLCPLLSVSQLSFESLQKYSYHIFGYRISINRNDSLASLKFYGGSGFFIRKEKRLFLVTSKHVLSGCEETGKDLLFPDEMAMWVSNDNNPKILYLDVKKIKDTSTCLPMTLSPDVIVIEIKDTVAAGVYSVEKLIRPPFKKIRNSLITGYPGIGGPLVGLGIQYVPPTKIILEHKTYTLAAQYTDSTQKKIDSINFYLFSEKNDFSKSLKGISGSPFFVQDLKTNKWRIAGVLVGQATTNRMEYGLMAADIKFVLGEVNRY